ncbi:hypothetical protein SADUNF_Sadunf11G0105500 [Salix dunnii]|uniref:Uncharacterized protein n=1 Tax=Salix dunnii TaxID=1413687 RepID=A0A835MTN2_9ROSI|nr:hypothetical protein SADUNF_Sadunf11G0105500 [Salix dunnii]
MENGEDPLRIMVLCMDRSHPLSVHMEGFRLGQCLAVMTNKQRCLKMTSLCCEPNVKAMIDPMTSLCCEPNVKAMIDRMTGWTSISWKVANDQLSLLVEACDLALIICMDGEHHDYF